MATPIGRQLNQKWHVGARHALYHEDGHFYERLTRFPGALFDSKGYVLFRTEQEFLTCPDLRLGVKVNVSRSVRSIRKMHGYVAVPAP